MLTRSRLENQFSNVRAETLKFLHSDHMRLSKLTKEQVYLELSRHLQLFAYPEYDSLRRQVLKEKAGSVVRHHGSELHPHEVQVFAKLHKALEEEGFAVSQSTGKFHLKEDQLRRASRTITEFRKAQ